MNSDKLLEKILADIDRMFGDTSVSQQKTIELLGEIQASVEMKIGAIEEDIKRQRMTELKGTEMRNCINCQFEMTNNAPFCDACKDEAARHPRQVPVFDGFAEHPEIKPAMEDPIAKQIYLAIAARHLRSQHFTSSVMNVARRITKAKPQTPDALAKILMFAKDPAVAYPWRTNRRAHGEMTRAAMLQILLDAINGIAPFDYVVNRKKPK